jgi:hypothetical protein
MRQMTEREWQSFTRFQNSMSAKLDRILSLLEQGKPATAEEPAPESPRQEQGSAAGLRHCKLCDFTCIKPGDMLKHHREAHPANKEK